MVGCIGRVCFAILQRTEVVDGVTDELVPATAMKKGVCCIIASTYVYI